MERKLLVDVIQKIALNAHITKVMLEDGKVVHAHRKLEGVIDQLNLLHSRVLSEAAEPTEAGK